MEILSIDVGSYSIKFLTTKLERGQTKLQACEEIVLREYALENKLDYKFLYDITEFDELNPEVNLEIQEPEEEEVQEVSAIEVPDDKVSKYELQRIIIKDYLENYPYQAKVIFQLPNEFTTTRYIDLPVTNKKKAELMIPFQLDEDLPSSINEVHYTSTLQIRNRQIFSLINISKLDVFSEYYRNLKTSHILPAILTSEVSIVQSFIDQKQMLGTYCILDLGHSTTKAYFVHDRHVISNHTSHIAGKSINEAIVKQYNITEDEVYGYKHENAFFLTEDQYPQMSEDQRAFALMLKNVVWPLVQDIKRWDLGYRVKYGHPVDRIYLCGGSSNIKNIENFLSQALSIETKKMKAIDALNQDEVSIPKKMAASFFLSHMISSIHKLKKPPANFLKGKFTSNFSQLIPIHSIGFVTTRVWMTCAVIILFMSIYNKAILNPQSKKLDREFSKIYNSPYLDFTKKDINTFRVMPERVLKKIKNDSKVITQEIKMIQSSSNTNTLYPLYTLNKIVQKNKNIDLIRYYYNNDKVEASFKGPLNELKVFKNFLDSSALNPIQVEVDEKELNLNLQFWDES